QAGEKRYLIRSFDPAQMRAVPATDSQSTGSARFGNQALTIAAAGQTMTEWVRETQNISSLVVLVSPSCSHGVCVLRQNVEIGELPECLASVFVDNGVAVSPIIIAVTKHGTVRLGYGGRAAVFIVFSCCRYSER